MQLHNVRGLSKTVSDREGRKFPNHRILFLSNLVKTDSPKCETETANRTLQTGSLTLPADGHRINFLKVAISL